MIWLTWRQFRAPAAAVFAALAALAAVLALTGPGLADDYSTGIAACTQSGDCEDFIQQFFNDHQTRFLAVTAVMLVLPALIGLFWGAPLITRELEAGTHRLVWNQSITRSRWLAVKLGITGLTAMAVAGLGSLAVTWWSSPIDKTSSENFPQMGPLLFDTRGIVPIGYAAFAFALGVTVGMLVRRTVSAMAVTLAVFVAVQVATPLLARPHFLAPTHAAVKLTPATLDSFSWPRDGGVLAIVADRARDADAWVLSSRLVDASGQTIDGTISVPTSSGPCAPPERPASFAGPETCLAELNRLGYRHELTYQPSSRYWTFQWIETALYLGLTLGLAGICFWRIRRLS